MPDAPVVPSSVCSDSAPATSPDQRDSTRGSTARRTSTARGPGRRVPTLQTRRRVSSTLQVVRHRGLHLLELNLTTLARHIGAEDLTTPLKELTLGQLMK